MKKLLISLAVISIVLICNGCEFFDDLIDVNDSPQNAPELVNDEIIEIYTQLDEIIASMGDNFVASGKARIKSIQVWEDLDKLYEESPEILAQRGIRGMEISYIEKREYLDITITPQYEMFKKVQIAYETDNLSILSAEEKKVFTKAEKVLKSVSSSSSIFDKIDAIHSHLIENVEYDDDYESNPNAFNVYGALIDGKAVCQGYAHAFKLLSHMAGVESLIITGNAGGESHAWNLVNLGTSNHPEWYHIDVTWNVRPNPNSEENDGTSAQFENYRARKSHRFFNISDNVIAVTHSWKRSAFPVANSSRYNYFRYRGIMAATLQNLESIFANLYTRGENFYEILCTFPIITDDLNFLHEYSDSDSFLFSFDEYGDNDILLTVIL